jgi:hypothetical protein
MPALLLMSCTIPRTYRSEGSLNTCLHRCRAHDQLALCRRICCKKAYWSFRKVKGRGGPCAPLSQDHYIYTDWSLTRDAESLSEPSGADTTLVSKLITAASAAAPNTAAASTSTRLKTPSAVRNARTVCKKVLTRRSAVSFQNFTVYIRLSHSFHTTLRMCAQTGTQ